MEFNCCECFIKNKSQTRNSYKFCVRNQNINA